MRMLRPRVLLSIVAAVVLLGTVAVAAAPAAGGDAPITVKVGSLELVAGGGFAPKVLSKTTQTPISVRAEGEIRNADGSHPPALREVRVEGDKNAEVHVKGIPVCTSAKLQATTTQAALGACGAALIGEGEVTAQVAYPEQAPIDVPSKLLLFNGGEKGGKITWYVHAYFSDPISGAVVTTLTITKLHHGRYGSLTVAKIPQITGGNGSILSFHLDIDRKVKVGNRSFNPISAKCADGKLKVHVLAKFEDGTEAKAEIVRACTAKS